MFTASVTLNSSPSITGVYISADVFDGVLVKAKAGEKLPPIVIRLVCFSLIGCHRVQMKKSKRQLGKYVDVSQILQLLKSSGADLDY